MKPSLRKKVEGRWKEIVGDNCVSVFTKLAWVGALTTGLAVRIQITPKQRVSVLMNPKAKS